MRLSLGGALLSFLIAIEILRSISIPLNLSAEEAALHTQTELCKQKLNHPMLTGVECASPSLEQTISVTLSTSGKLTHSVFPVENPARIVIDLPSSSAPIKKELAVAKNPWIRSIRIGSHPGKVRIVLDLVQDKIPEYSVGTQGNKLTLRIGIPSESLIEAEAVASATGATPSPTTSPTPIPATPTPLPTVGTPLQEQIKISSAARTAPRETPTATPSPSVTPNLTSVATVSTPTLLPATPSPTPLPTITATIMATITATNPTPISDGGVRLDAIRFDIGNEATPPTIVLVLNSRPTFRLNKVDQRTYKIVVQGASLAREALALPFFPPQEFTGFSHVQSFQRNNHLEITIGTEFGTRLQALPQDNNILVRGIPAAP